MSVGVLAASPPSSTWTDMPDTVAGTIGYWLNVTAYVCVGLSIITVIVFGALMVIDKHRGEPISATAPYMRAVQIALGVFFISSAWSVASFFIQ